MGYYEQRKAVCNDLKSFLKEHNGKDIAAEQWRSCRNGLVLTHGASEGMIFSILAQLKLRETVEGGLENA